MSEAARIDVGRSPVRCPYCHADVDPAGDAWVACAGCLARHHDACWVEGGACGACGGVDALARTTGVIVARPVRVDPKAAPARPRAWLVGLAVAVVFLATFVVGALFTSTAPPAELGPVVIARRVVDTPRVEPVRDWARETVDPLDSLHTASGHALVRVLGEYAGKHAGTVTAVAFLPGDRQLISGSQDGTVRVWDAATLRELALPVARTGGSVSTMAVTLDGRHALIACEDLALRLVELSSGRELVTLRGHTSAITAVALSPDGRFAASGDYDGPLRLWDVATGKQVAAVTDVRCAYDIAFAPDGATLLVGSPAGATLIEVSSGAVVRKLLGHSDRVQTVQISPDARTALTGSQDKTIRVWDLASGRCTVVLEGHDSEVQDIAISPDGALAVSCSMQDDLRLWNLRTGALDKVLPGHRGGFVRSVAFSARGLSVVSGGSDHSLRVWDVESGRELVDVSGHRGAITQLAESDGARLATGSVDETVRVWNVETGRELRAAHVDEHRALSVALSPDGRTVAAGGASGLAFVDVESGRVTRLAAPRGHWIEALAFTRDGERLWAWPRHERLRAFDVATGGELLTPLATSEVLRGPLALAPDGRLALAQVADRSVQLIDLETYERRMLVPGNDGGAHAAFALTAWDAEDGPRLLTGTSPHHLRAWDARSLERLCVSSGPTDPVRVVAIRGDGRLAASAGGQAILVWELSRGQQVDRIDLGSSHDQVTTLAFSRDGRTLYAGTARGVVLVLRRR